MCGIDGAGLAETVERFNANAEQGIDPDYGRGESAYNRALGDPNPKVHPCLGPIDEPPYYACRGACPATSAPAAASSPTSTPGSSTRTTGPIDGLYATGNITATVMGRHYLGPGASIANSMVFGYLAVLDATGGGGTTVASRQIGPDGIEERNDG